MKKRNVAAIIGATVAAIGTVIGIGALVKSKKTDAEECDACEDEAYEESDSEEEESEE